MKEYYVSTDNAKILVKEQGDGCPVVLIHGGPALPGYMNSLGSKLKEEARVFEYYQRDVFFSPSKGPYRICDHVEDLDQIISYVYKKEGKKPILLGHSWGGILALLANKTFVSKVILIGTGPLDFNAMQSASKKIFDKLSKEQQDKKKDISRIQMTAKSNSDWFKAFSDGIKTDLPSYFFTIDSSLMDTILTDCKLRIENVPSTKMTIDSYISSLKENSLAMNIKLDCEVILFHGEEDVFDYRTVDSYLRSSPMYKFFLLKECGHFPWLELETKELFIKELLSSIK